MLSEAKMSNILVLSVVTSRWVTPVKHSAKCTAEQTVRASKKKIALVGAQAGSWHWYPSFSDVNQTPKPCAEASM